MAGRGKARLGKARLGAARLGEAWIMVWLGPAWLGWARHGVARPGAAWPTARLGEAWHGEAWRGMAGLGEDLGAARQGAAGRGPARRGVAGRGMDRGATDTRNNFPVMYQKSYKIDIVGATPLLLHYDNISWAEFMKVWGSDPANREKSVPGDDRTPTHRWVGCLYTDAGLCVIPADNLMTVLREGGARCPKAKGRGTFKSQSQSGIVVDQAAWPLLVNGKTISFEPFSKACEMNLSFPEHEALARKHGFTLFVKRAKVGTSKHIRVRPRFDNWAISGTVTVFDESITADVLENIVTFAGRFAGLGDWRPSSKQSPGPWGKFTATVSPI